MSAERVSCGAALSQEILRSLRLVAARSAEHSVVGSVRRRHGRRLAWLHDWLHDWLLMDRAVYESTSRSIDPNCKKHRKGSLSEPLNL